MKKRIRYTDPSVGFRANSAKPNVRVRVPSVVFKQHKVSDVKLLNGGNFVRWMYVNGHSSYSQMKCPCCGNDFMAKKSAKRKVCSKSCAGKMLNEKKAGRKIAQ